MSDTPPPPAVDYAGTPLNVGDSVAFILTFDSRPALYSGSVALIKKDQVCVESGNLHVIKGVRWNPSGGPEGTRYATIIRKPDGDA